MLCKRLHDGWMIMCAAALLLAAGAGRAAAPTTGTQATTGGPATMDGQATTGTQEAKVEVKSTRENLLDAYDDESNAHVRYLAFAKKADEEGYKGVGSLFRAAARSEEVHAHNHAAVLKKMDVAVPKAEIKPPEVKSTRENLEAAIKGETYESTAMYPAFIKKARADRNRAAVRTFNYARQVEARHARLYKTALDNLTAWKKGPRTFYVCPECGNTVTAAGFTFKKCPICSTPRSKFEKIS